ncbi:MAG: TonB-dependent receptor, partial [Gammaproteobacteria bacterium]
MNDLRHTGVTRPGYIALAMTVAAVAGPVHAQPRDLEEIVVTATPINQSLGNVAAAVSVIEQDDIQLARQQLALDESLSRVPGIFMQNRYNFAQDLRVAIRGFGARAAFGIRGIKILVDGIPETLPDGQGSVDSIDLGSTERIEVLRGPSSSMYGNASGGVISITTEAPPEDHVTQIRASAGDYGFRKLQAKVAGTAGAVGYVVSASESELDGYRAQSNAESTQLSARLRFDLRNDQELTTVFNYTDQPVSDDPGGINLAQALADPRSARDLNVSMNGGEALEQTRIGFVYEVPIGQNHSVRLRNHYIWRDFSANLPLLPVNGSGGQVEFDRFYAGFGLTYAYSGQLGGLDNELLIGFDIDSQDDDRMRFDNNFGTRGPLVFDQNEQVESRGIFVQDVLELSDTIALSFGIRFNDVEYDVSDRYFADGFDDSGTLKFSDTSPMLGINVALTDALNIYANFSTSFETPTTTELANSDASGGFNQSLDSQTAENLEVGLRGSFGERNLFEVAVFDIEVDNELLPWESQSGREFFRNAGSSSRTGVEFSLVSEPTSRLRTTLSYTVSDFEFDNYVTFDGDNYSGNDIPGIADSVLFAEITYTHPRGWFASLDAMRVGEQFANDSNSVRVDGYTLANLRIGADFESGSARLSPFVGINNLTDESYFSNIRI